MKEFENPFTPTFGEIPEHFAGRKDIVANVEKAFVSARRRPELTSLFSGARGMGKTTLLSVLATKAAAQGWVCASTTAMPGMLNDLESGIRKNAAHLLGDDKKPALTGVEIGGIGAVSFAQPEAVQVNWRYRIDAILDQLSETETGLLITVDEVDASLAEMVELVAVYQHFVRENRKVALLMAGLPHHISSLMNDNTVSFLRRAQLVRLGPIADYEVKDALARTIEGNGRSASDACLQYAVDAIDGFPFLLQLVGFRAWDQRPSQEEMSLQDFERGVELAKFEMDDRILGATYKELSPGDIRFLTAMLEDDGDSKIADITVRLERSSAQVAQYRKRLIDAGVIGERARGIVGFDMPYFKEYLKANV